MQDDHEGAAVSVPVPAEPAVPAEAARLAAEAIHDLIWVWGDGGKCMCPEAVAHEDAMRQAYASADVAPEAAAPAIRADERQRLADEIPSLIVKIDGELSPAAIEQVKHNFRAALAEHDRCGKEASAAVALILAKTDRIAELESRLRDSHQAIHDLHADRDHDEQRISELADRIAGLEQLARDILATFHFGAMHAHATARAEQIAQWEATLKGEQ